MPSRSVLHMKISPRYPNHMRKYFRMRIRKKNLVTLLILQCKIVGTHPKRLKRGGASENPKGRITCSKCRHYLTVSASRVLLGRRTTPAYGRIAKREHYTTFFLALKETHFT